MRKFILKVKGKLHIPYSDSDRDYLLLGAIKDSGICKILKMGPGHVEFSYNNDVSLQARLHPHSDLWVCKQVLLDQEYSMVKDFFNDNFPDQEDLKIIDAGANIGYTSVYLKSHFPGSRIACIEPAASNIEVLQRNLYKFINLQEVFVFQNALMSEDDKNLAIHNNFRDGKDWSIAVEETNTASSLKSISVRGVMKSLEWEEVDILKIDIEGAERFIFREYADLDFLSKVGLLALEIHDEFNIREKIYDLLKNHNFLILNYGETILAINKRRFSIK